MNVYLVSKDGTWDGVIRSRYAMDCEGIRAIVTEYFTDVLNVPIKTVRVDKPKGVVRFVAQWSDGVWTRDAWRLWPLKLAELDR